ncbi:MAG: capsule assembly Wzi family protein [Bacteroidia bacterium]|nr:capsule assembly Wzi family protein [Bacteroidia bacterium]
MKRILSFLLLLFISQLIFAQNGDWILGHDVYHYVDRLDVLGYYRDGVDPESGSDGGLPVELKPYGRDKVASWVKQASEERMSMPEKRWQERMRVQTDDLLADSTGVAGLWGTFGTNRRDLYHVNQPGFRMYVNPVLYLTGGLDRTNDPAAAQEALPLYNNLRGLVIRGSIGEKIGFHTEAGDFLARIPEFQYRRFRATGSVDGEEEIKQFGNVNGVNYFKTRGYLTAQAVPWLRIKLGKDRVQWGNGWQSLILSDQAADAYLLNLHASFWKLEYVSHFAQFIDYFPGKNDQEGDYPRKYGAFHALFYRPVPNVSVGVFESVIYSPVQPYGRRGFELQYLNPVIFYRSVEQFVGSPDNAMIGVNMKVNLWNTMQLYGQGIIDDFNFGNRVNGPGYWGNQWGLQGGIKYYNAFTIPTLDLQLEYNRVRPYVYQHFNVVSNYSQYGASLGHAAGGNVQDWNLMLQYHPLPGWNLQLVGSMLDQGRDQGGKNYGWDITNTYQNRPQEYGNTVGQGEAWSVQQLWGRLSWQVGATDVYVEAEGRYRRESLGAATPAQSLSMMAGLRISAAPARVRW